MDGLVSGAKYEVITVTPASPTVGAEIGNIDLTRPLTDPELAEVKRAFLEFGVLFFRDQKISFEDQTRLGAYFGDLGEHVGKKTNSQTTEDPKVRKMHADGGQAHAGHDGEQKKRAGQGQRDPVRDGHGQKVARGGKRHQGREQQEPDGVGQHGVIPVSPGKLRQIRPPMLADW